MPSLVKLYPSRLTITPERSSSANIYTVYDRYRDPLAKLNEPSWLTNFKKQGNPFVLSKSTKRKMFDSINSMYELASKRRIKMQSGKEIYNFKCAFITLTLPSNQIHSDIDIKKELLNQILVELRKHAGMKNYVWKAELQKNGNVHFHIVTDVYVDFQNLRRRWNRCVNKLGYVDRYRERMSKMSLSEYHAMRGGGHGDAFVKSSQAFASGQSSKWSNPNSVDVRSVSNNKDLASYLGKYMSKNVSDEDASDEELSRMYAFGRTWGRSESLSRLQYKNYYSFDDLVGLVEILKTKVQRVHKVVGDWFTSYYFNVSNLPPKVAIWYREALICNASIYSYPFT